MHHSNFSQNNNGINKFDEAMLAAEEGMLVSFKESVVAADNFKNWLDVEVEVAEIMLLSKCLQVADPTSCEWFAINSAWQQQLAVGNHLECACCGYKEVSKQYENLTPCPCCGSRVFSYTPN